VAVLNSSLRPKSAVRPPNYVIPKPNVQHHLIAARPSRGWGVYRALVWAARPGGAQGKRDNQGRDDLPVLFSPTFWTVSMRSLPHWGKLQRDMAVRHKPRLIWGGFRLLMQAARWVQTRTRQNRTSSCHSTAISGLLRSTKICACSGRCCKAARCDVIQAEEASGKRRFRIPLTSAKRMLRRTSPHHME
jgi:hypothetical protein